jgi:inhibitor of cysteine peptidase
MKRRGRVVCVLAVVAVVAMLAAMLGACGGDDASSSGSSGDAAGSSEPTVYGAGDSISVANGDTFVIALEANPTTGYSWEAEPNDDVEFVSSKQVQGSSNAIGAPGTQQLTFKAVQTGSSTLTLHYLRPFEQGVPPAETEEFDVTVK